VEDALVRADLARKALIVQELKIDNKFDYTASWDSNGK
jgi:hypothetical protein